MCKSMDPRIKRLTTVEACDRFAANATRLERPDLADEARERAIQIRAESHGAESVAEQECLQAIYAYEEVLSSKNGRRTSASRTWQMIKRHGILEAAERAVNRDQVTSGYTALVEMGLQEYAFEAVILRHPEEFSGEAVNRSKQRMQEWATID